MGNWTFGGMSRLCRVFLFGCGLLRPAAAGVLMGSSVPGLLCCWCRMISESDDVEEKGLFGVEVLVGAALLEDDAGIMAGPELIRCGGNGCSEGTAPALAGGELL